MGEGGGPPDQNRLKIKVIAMNYKRVLQLLLSAKRRLLRYFDRVLLLTHLCRVDFLDRFISYIRGVWLVLYNNNNNIIIIIIIFIIIIIITIIVIIISIQGSKLIEHIGIVCPPPRPPPPPPPHSNIYIYEKSK